jgi:hypothetical protein
MKFISTDYYTSGASVLRSQERGLLTLHQTKKRSNSKKAKEIISYISKDFTVAVEDESIFIHDALIRRRMWTPEGIRPIVTVTGSHQRTCVFGTITIDGKQLFRQYDLFSQYVFLKYLKELQRKFRKLLLFIDRAVQVVKSNNVDLSPWVRLEYRAYTLTI